MLKGETRAGLCAQASCPLLLCLVMLAGVWKVNIRYADEIVTAQNVKDGWSVPESEAQAARQDARRDSSTAFARSVQQYV